MGGVITFPACIEYNNGTPPVGPTPWLVAQFDDQGTPGSVALTLTATNLTGAEHVKGWYFNLDPNMGPNNLTFSALTEAAGNFDLPTITVDENNLKADGDGFFDILFAFATKDDHPKRFTSGDSFSCTLGGIASLTASSFDFISAPDGGQGIYPTAAHVLSTGVSGQGSGWVTIPEPGILSLLALGGLALIRRTGRR